MARVPKHEWKRRAVRQEKKRKIDPFEMAQREHRYRWALAWKVWMRAFDSFALQEDFSG